MTKDKATRITSWLATGFPSQDLSWEACVLQALGLPGVDTTSRSLTLESTARVPKAEREQSEPGLWPYASCFQLVLIPGYVQRTGKPVNSKELVPAVSSAYLESREHCVMCIRDWQPHTLVWELVCLLVPYLSPSKSIWKSACVTSACITITWGTC